MAELHSCVPVHPQLILMVIIFLVLLMALCVSVGTMLKLAFCSTPWCWIILACCMSRGSLVIISPDLVICTIQISVPRSSSFLWCFCPQHSLSIYYFSSVGAVAGEALKDKQHEANVVAAGGQFYPLIVETKTASNMQPSDLCLNAFRSLPGDQDAFSLFFHAFISTGTLESDLLSCSTSCGT